VTVARLADISREVSTPDQPRVNGRARRIAHVLNGLRYGGNENLCLQLIKHSPPSYRHFLFNLNPSSKEMIPVFEQQAGLTLLDRPYRREERLSFVAAMARDLRRMNIDGIIVYSFGLHVLVGLAGRLCGIRDVIAHAGNPPPIDPQRRQLWKEILLVSRVLRIPIKSCSFMVQGELRALTGKLPRRSEAISNGVDVDHIEAIAAAERAQKPEGSPRVVGMVAAMAMRLAPAAAINAAGLKRIVFILSRLAAGTD